MEGLNRRQTLVTQICERLTDDAKMPELLDCWYNHHFETLHQGEDVTVIDRALELEIITLEEAQELARNGF